MDKKLELIFSNYNIYFNDDEISYFNNASLQELIFSKSKNKINLILNIENFLPTKLIEKIESELKNNSEIPASIKLNVLNNNFDEDYLWELILFIKNKKAQIKSGFLELVKRESVFFNKNSNEIIIKVSNPTVKKHLHEHEKYYLKKLEKYGYKKLNLKIIEEKEDLQEIVNKYDKEIEKLTENNSKIIEEKNKFVNNNFSNEKFKSNSNNFKFKRSSTIKTRLENEPPTYKKLEDLEDNIENIIIHAYILKKEVKVSKKSGRSFCEMVLTDDTSSISSTYFAQDDKPILFSDPTEEQISSGYYEEHKNEFINTGDWLALYGSVRFSSFKNEAVFYINEFLKINDKIKINERNDNEVNKRVELHTHTKMSTLDGVSEAKDYINLAVKWGHKAIAITDHLNVQTFPDAYAALKNVNKNLSDENKFKLIYGSHLNLINDDVWYVKNATDIRLDEAKLVIFDLETTGLSPEEDEIIEFGATIIEPNESPKKIDILIKPKNKISSFTTKLTNITNEMLENKQPIEVEFKKIYEILNNGVLVAHNANFDIGFLQSYCRKLGYPELDNTMIDTLTLSRIIVPEIKSHRLGAVAKKLGVFYDEEIAHRADYDAEILANVYEHLIFTARKNNQLRTFNDINKLQPENIHDNLNFKKARGHHVSVLAKNQDGLKELYELISLSHVKDFFNSPKILRSHLFNKAKKRNLLIGAPCLDSEIFDLVMTGSYNELKNKMSDYDYIEVQPLSACKHLWQKGDLTEDRFKYFINKIIEFANELNILVVATSDAHYTEPSLSKIREVYINTKGLGGVAHPLFDYKGRIAEYPDHHMRTTKEMLDEFEWLGNEKLIEDIVINNTNVIADMIDQNIIPVKSGSYPPSIENVDKLLTDECYRNAKNIYGDVLPEIVEARLKRELDSIIKHGFAVIYWISHKLVKKSLDDGYLVGSRGSVGSSFVATTSNITEVNPLKAHYICDQCKFSDFDTPKEFKCGYDLPNKNCPKCNYKLRGEGHDIPFETFLGFDGDKVPDIDLNFSGEYQLKAHDFTKEMFGEHNVFRAGTISTVADKTAYGYVKSYLEKKYGFDNLPRQVEIERLASLATGVKRTTGQHPGGIIILPKEYSIESFTPVNYPADDDKSSWLTTHFDFHSIHDNLLKMDILGHVDPTALKMLKDLTGVDPLTISTSDEKVYSLFSSLDVLNIDSKDINGETTGAIGIPEFGTSFVRGMLKETKPKTFADLVQISGLSHGTDVWLNNAQNLIKEKVADISSVIGCRDDIMVYLLSMGLTSNKAFSIMESVRKGNGLKTEDINLLKEHNVPQWYIDSCLKIKYMFPKAHATAYVLMAYRVAWYKIYYPAEYYATFFSTRIDAIDIKKVCNGPEEIKEHLHEIESKQSKNIKITPKEKALITTYEVALEMYARGIKMEKIDFNLSAAINYTVKVSEDGTKSIVPPFKAIDSLGEAVANSIVNAREIKKIISVNDLKLRTQVTQTQIKIFQDIGAFDSLSNDEQLAFDF